MKKASSLRMLAFFMACMVVITTCFTVSISAVWNYNDEGTGMPDPDDPTEGLPFPDAEDEYAITEYSFNYVPEILDAETKAVIKNAKAGDVILLSVSARGIDLAKAPLGLSSFEGGITYDVENLPLFLNGSTYNSWYKKCINFILDAGMSDSTEVKLNKNNYWTPADPDPYEEEGYGLHWGVAMSGNDGANGIVNDDSFRLVFPLIINENAEEGDEFTFTMPYPDYEQFANEYVLEGSSPVRYARGGSFTITIKNHADVEANIATDAVYSITPIGYDFGEKAAGYLNDKLIPLTENSKYEGVQGDVALGMDFAAPADVSGVTVTFNDTNNYDLPQSVTVYGVDANGGHTLLGTQNVGTAFDEGFAYDDATTVNAGNAYKYTVSGFDVADYVGIYVEAEAGDSGMMAIGEVEVEGEYSKYNVTVENGTIENAAADNDYLPGTVLNITADEIADKNFIGWEIVEGGAGEFADASANSTTFTVGNANTVIKAVYEDVLYGLEVQYGSGSGQYAKDTVVDIVADPAEYGKVFSHWEVVSGDAVVADPNASSTTVTTASGSSVVVAVFEDAPRYMVYVDLGSVGTEPDEGYEGYLTGTVVTLIPPTGNEVPEGKVFIGWETLCGSGTLDSANNTFTVGTGDAEIFAKFADIHKPVEDNLAPDSDFMFTVGTPDVNTLGTADSDGWYDGGYINDQLYPLLAEGKWVPVTTSNNKFTVIARLNGAYDINGAAVTVAYIPGDLKNIPPIGVNLYGANKADGSDATFLVELNANQMSATDGFIAFDEGIDLTSIAAKRNLEVPTTLIASYQYVVFEFTCLSASTNYRVGELEIFGTKSLFEVTIENGTINNAAADNKYLPGTVLDITAEQIADKVFTGWTIVGEDGAFADASAATTTFTVGTSNAVIVANYRDVLYTLTVNNGTGDGDYVRGSQVTVTADNNADPEKVFDKWIVVSGSASIADPSNATTTVTTDGEAVIEATYKNRIYGLTVENGTGSGDYAKGTVVDITANAAPADMIFSHWTIVSGSGTLEDANSATTKFTTSNEATTLRAVYVDVLYSVEVDGGKITTEGTEWKVGTELTIEAIVPEHKTFVKWKIVSGAGSFANANEANTTFTTGSGDTVIKAIFEDVEYTLTVENGTGSGDYVIDTEVEIEANVPDGFIFAGWEVVEGEVAIADADAAKTTVTIKGDATVKATFVEKEYTVDIINGKVDDEDKADSYKKGTEITIIADDAEANMHFAGWVIVSGDATIADANSAETTVTVGSSDVVIRAEYTDDLYTITVENGTATGIDENGNKVGDVITIEADKAPAGKEFDKWEIVSGEGTIADETAEKTTFTLGAANTVIKATYKDVVPTPGTGDAGMAVFALLAVASLIGTAVVLKKKKD